MLLTLLNSSRVHMYFQLFLSLPSHLPPFWPRQSSGPLICVLLLSASSALRPSFVAILLVPYFSATSFLLTYRHVQVSLILNKQKSFLRCNKAKQNSSFPHTIPSMVNWFLSFKTELMLYSPCSLCVIISFLNVYL